MAEVKIIYNGYPTIIQAQPNEIVKEIFKRFKIKIKAENKELIFLYNGEIIKDDNINISKLTAEKVITILACDSINMNSGNNNLVKPDYVICPICKEIAILDEKDYKLIIKGCQNKHITKNILFNDFNKFQNIDYSNIICNKCKKNNRNITYNKEFFYCDICRINLCPICKLNHDNNHKIINYNDKEFKCGIHNENYISYCNKCEKNICMSCENEHSEHSIIYYGKLIIQENKIINRMKEIRKEIDIFNNDIKEKINKLNKIIENIEEYYKIIDNIIKNSINNKRRNYQLLITINNIINNNNMINNIKRINNNKNKYDDIIDIYNKIYNNYNKNNQNNNDILNNKNNENNDENNNIINKNKENNDKKI